MRSGRRAVVVVCDSLCADLVAPHVAPALAALRAQGADFVSARGVFPSTTRTSSASMATGCLPAAHGLLGNTMVLREQGALVRLSVGKPDFLERLRRATGRTLRRPTWAERLARQGGAIVMSNVSPGAAYLQDPDGFGHVYHRAGSRGPGGVALTDGLAIEVGAAGDRAMTDRFCREVLRERAPALAVLWLSEPDHTAHGVALGSGEHLAMIAHADACVDQVRRTVEALDPAGDEILLVACSDHGMETVERKIDLDALLVEAGWKRSHESQEVVVAPNGNAALLYFADEARDAIPALVRWLQDQDFTGRVFAGQALAEIGLPTEGPLGLALALRHDASTNPHGVPGRSVSLLSPFSDSSPVGCAQHGGLGEHEQHPFLYLRGGGLRPGERRQPASLIDIAPTVLRHLGVAADGMQGRALQ
ncbi:alkaline phosphatase family protein [Variovorax sp. Varisp41]|jgi:predicted AlkP superfamily pyrophosphatase or phosphodiesterase|uniref:alkaline phosphatase family protein n=1 Tax=unclassified Variovorax TaxID=663243 RepID=UPI000C394A9D|nr:alkaline phosphatase family protein [Variovorax sp.]MBS79377.1 alkaline phosphatase family protein [Variovorax sp.]